MAGIINAFILAAGLGERLRPITEYIPKPLLPVLGKPILEYVIEKIDSPGVGRIGINAYYKWEMVRDWLDRSAYSGRVTFFLEKEILGTGGALKNAADMLKERPFLVHNSDIVSDIDLAVLKEKHLSSDNIATLAVHHYPKFNNVWVDGEGILKVIGKNAPKKHRGLTHIAFTGIAVYSPDFLQFLPKGRSCLVAAWLRASAKGRKVGTVDFSGCKWDDIGTPEAYSAAVFDALKNEGETLFLHPSVRCPGEAGANTVMEEGAIIEGIPQTRNCIVLPGGRLTEGGSIENAIVGPGYSIGIGKKFDADFPAEGEMSLIGTGGSDRNYFRIGKNGKTAVLMECPAADPDYQRHIILTNFLAKHLVPVPQLLGTDITTAVNPSMIRQGFKYALFEDLGDISLYSWLKCRRDKDRIETAYRRVIDIAVRLHTAVTQHISECPVLSGRVFDYEHFRWETRYFIDRFLVELKNVDVTVHKGLDDECNSLAKKSDIFKKTLIHRDLQSQNIMMTQNGNPRLIDYQGSRVGPPAYDIASLLWDPYYVMDDMLRIRLIEYYIYNMKTSADFDESEFRESLVVCRLQRHMQALGAYSFLSKVKGKRYFLKYVPAALRYLQEEVGEVRDKYPALFSLIKSVNARRS